MRKTAYLVLLLPALALVLLTGCSSAGKDIVSGTGTVSFINLEGGFYGIIGDDGKHYDPINLSQEFRQDGLRVQFEARIRKDVATTHMWGTPVEINKIELCKT